MKEKKKKRENGRIRMRTRGTQSRKGD